MKATSINDSFDQLKLEDELEEYYYKWNLCNDIVDLYGKANVEEQIVDLFHKEIISNGKEMQFEDYMKESNFTNDDLRFTNRIKEMIQQRSMEVFETIMSEQKEELESLKNLSEQHCKQIAHDTHKLKQHFSAGRTSVKLQRGYTSGHLLQGSSGFSKPN